MLQQGRRMTTRHILVYRGRMGTDYHGGQTLAPSLELSVPSWCACDRMCAIRVHGSGKRFGAAVVMQTMAGPTANAWRACLSLSQVSRAIP
jgi:hypothetical protein